MDNKFYEKDISKFDPSKASAEEVRKWVYAIIDAELEKDPEEIDYDLLEQCAKLEAELPDMDFEISESEYAAGLERIKALVPMAEHKETKVLKPKKKTKKSIRIIAILAASLAVLLLSVTTGAAVQGKPVMQFISENIQVILGMNTGDKLENGNVTLVKYGKSSNYSSVEEAVAAIGADILYPTYLPEGVEIERIIVTENGEDGLKISFLSNFENLWIDIIAPAQTFSDDLTTYYFYNNGQIDFYILEKSTICQAMAWYKNTEYSILYNNYDELINILNGIKEIEK